MGSNACFLMSKTKLVNFRPHLSAFFCSSPWANAGGISPRWGCFLGRAAFWGSAEMLVLPGAVFGRFVHHACPSLRYVARVCRSQQHPEQGRGAVTAADGPEHSCTLFLTAPLQDPEAVRMSKVGLPEEGSALLFWKVAPYRGHPAVTAVTIHTSAFPHSWGEWPSLAVIVGDFSLLQRPTVTVRLQISQGGLGWVLPLCQQHSLFSGLNAVSVPACPLCTLISCSIDFMQGRKKETRARKELLSAKAAPGESQCCQLGLVSGKWGPKGCPRMYCMEEAVRGAWGCAGTSRSPAAA